MNGPAIRRLGDGLTVVSTLAGLVASAVLLVDYLRPAAVYCDDAGSGCAQLRATTYAAWAGVPTPAVGLVGFAVLGVLALFGNRSARLAHLALSGAAAAFAAFLLAVQARMGVFCRFCVVVDVSALVLLAGSLLRFRIGELTTPRWMRPAFGSSMVLAAAAPIAFGFARPLPPPSARHMPDAPEAPWPLVEKERAATPGDRITIVDFVDFECPFCRMTHQELSPALEKHASEVRVVRKNVPLRSIHLHAMDAAKAACCGKKLGKENEMAEALFSAPVEELTPEGCEKIASKIGVDPNAFRACFADEATTASVEADVTAFKSSGGRSLPTIWIEDTKFIGAQDRETLERAIERAIEAKKRQKNQNG